MKPSTNDSQLKGLLTEIQKMSTEDGPGLRTTVFFKECPLRCLWCHNPETIVKEPSLQWMAAKCIGCGLCLEACPNAALSVDSEENQIRIDRGLCKICLKCAETCPSTALQAVGTWWTVDELFTEIAKDTTYYETSGGGVTFSGGEPLLQFPFLLKMLRRCQDAGIHTALDTSGLAPQERFEELFPFVDLFLFDLKVIDPNKHKEWTGVSNKQILKNCEWLATKIQESATATKDLWIRTPIIPGYTADRDVIYEIAEFILDKLGNAIGRWDLLAFNNLARTKYERMNLDWACREIELMTAEEFMPLFELAADTGVTNIQWESSLKKD